MKKRKKRAALLFCLGVTLLCGCSAKGDPLLKAEAGAKELKIGCVEYEPYNYVNEAGEWIGIDADLAREACKRLGFSPVFVMIKWNEKDEFLKNGSIDCIWNCFTMNGREEDYLWAGPYMTSKEVVMVKEESPIETLDELSDKIVAVQSSTKPEEIFLSDNERSAGYVYCFKELKEALFAVQEDYADAVAGHQAFLDLYSRGMNSSYRILEEPLIVSQIGVAFSKKADPEMAEQLNRVLHEMNRNGTVGAILKKYEVASDLALTEGDAGE